MTEYKISKYMYSIVWLVAIIVVAIIVAVTVNVQTANGPIEYVSEVETVPVVPGILETPSNGSTSNSQFSGAINLVAPSSVSLGQDVVVEVRLDTGGNNINLARVSLRYDPQKLIYKEFEASGSVLGLKLREEISTSQVTVIRGAPGDTDHEDQDDGYTGTGGLFGKFIFTALLPGRASVLLDESETRMLLDDGRGTEMELELNGISLVIN